jgi:hypothetical protein
MTTTCPYECPICLDDIFVTSNHVTTECGHTFHTSCLMKNVAHRGFACPCCRTTMAEEPENDDNDVYHYSNRNQEDEDEDDEFEYDRFDDIALRGFRFFMNNLEGTEHEHEDILEEQEDMEEEDSVDTPKPTPAFIVQKLMEQGVTMEDLVKSMLKDHEEYNDEEEEYMQIDDDLFGKFRIVISNYTPTTP